MVDDDTGYIEVVLFNEVFYEYRDILNKDEIIVVDGSLRYDDFASSWQINANNVIKVDKIIEKKASSMMLVLSSETQSSNLLSKLHDLLYLYRDGDCEVSIQYADNDISTHMELSSEWSVRPCYELREKLSELLFKMISTNITTSTTSYSPVISPIAWTPTRPSIPQSCDTTMIRVVFPAVT